jgi:hypothetical protein
LQVVGLQPSPEQGITFGQLPVLQRPGEIEPTWLAFQERQIVDWFEKSPFSVPRTSVASHEPILIHKPNFLDCGHHHELAMGVLDRD